MKSPRYRLKYILKLLSGGKQLFTADSLFRNAIFLMASAGIMSALGFGFWIFVAHLYTASDIGVASALMAITLLISNLSLLGLNSGLIRFLPESKNQSRDINAALITVGLASLAAAGLYLLFGPKLTSQLAFITHYFWGPPLFMVMLAAVALNSLTDSVFIANRKAGFHTAAYAIFGVVKLVVPLFLVRYGSLGIFAAYMSAVMVSLAVSLYFMSRNFGYKFKSSPNWGLLRLTKKYAGSNYLAVILAGLPSQLMPIFIIARLGSAQAGYFSMAWMMANLLYVVPSSITQSMLAESSHSIDKRTTHMRSAVRLLSLILVPGVAFAVLVAPFVLQIFGAQYATGSTSVFQLLAAATFLIAINNLREATLNLEHNSGRIVFVQLANALATIGSANYLLRYGVKGAAFATLLGYLASSITHFGLYIWERSRVKQVPSLEAAQSLSLDDLRPSISKKLQNYGIHNFDFSVLSHGASSMTILVREQKNQKVLKVYGRRHKQYGIQQELQFIERLVSMGLPVPRIIHDTAGQYLSTIKDDAVSDNFVLMEFETGEHPTSYNDALITQMAGIQARIHVAGMAYATIVGDEPNSRPLTQRGSRVLAFMSRLRLLPSGYSHFDFDKTNILVDHNTITCVLDFEGMRYDTLVSCIFFTLSNIYRENHDFQMIQGYLRAYENVRKLNQLEKMIIRVALMLRYSKLSLVELGTKTT